MVRIIVRTDDANMACNVGGAVEVKYRTFDVELPVAVESFLRQVPDHSRRQVVGVELLENQP